MSRLSVTRSWTESASVVFPVLAVAAALVVVFSEHLAPWCYAVLLLNLVPWALLAAGRRLRPLTVAMATIAPALALSLRGIQGAVMMGLVTVVWLGSASTSRRLALAGSGVNLLMTITSSVVSHHGLDKGALYFPMGVLLTFLCGELMCREKRLVTELQVARERLSERAAEQERTRIAREVHDVVGHSLTVVQLHVIGARRQLSINPAGADAALAKAEEIGRESLDHLRQVVGLLRNDTSESSGAAAPQPSARDIPALVLTARDAALDINLDVDGNLEDVDAAAGLAMYRVAQESIANARHHAPGAAVRMLLSVRCRHLNLRVNNALTKVAATASEKREGTGLIGMRERVAACHGELHAGPTREAWEVECRIPLTSDRR
jgi:signal transduction histidine kinase